MRSPQRLAEAEKHTRFALSVISVLRQLSEHLELPTPSPLVEEVVALARAQRRALRAAHAQLEADPLMAHLLTSRLEYRKAVQRATKSDKRIEELVRSSFFIAQSLSFRGGIDEWRKLLAIYPS